MPFLTLTGVHELHISSEDVLEDRRSHKARQVSLTIIRRLSECFDIVSVGFVRSASMAVSIQSRNVLSEALDFISERAAWPLVWWRGYL